MIPKFEIYTGETGGLMTSDKYLNFKWINPDCNILFSVTRQGNAASVHFASDEAGRYKLKEAVEDWCEFCFWLFDWCTIIVGVIKRHSVCKLAEKCGFTYLMPLGDKLVYVRGI